MLKSSVLVPPLQMPVSASSPKARPGVVTLRIGVVLDVVVREDRVSGHCLLFDRRPETGEMIAVDQFAITVRKNVDAANIVRRNASRPNIEGVAVYSPAAFSWLSTAAFPKSPGISPPIPTWSRRSNMHTSKGRKARSSSPRRASISTASRSG